MTRTNRRAASALRLEMLENRTLLNADARGLASFHSLRVDPGSSDPTSILVRYRDDAVARGRANAYLQGTEVAASFDLVPGLREVKLGHGIGIGDALAAYRANPDVLYVQPNYRVHIELAANDPSYADGALWGLHNTGQDGGKVDADIDAPEAWEITTGRGNTLVAVIDSGVDYTHPDLAENIWTNLAEVAGDGIDNDGNGFLDDVHGYDFANNDGDPMDDHGHGTHVAGTIAAAANNGIGVTGVNWNTQVMALKFLDASGSGNTSDAIRALEYAVKMGARISNNSWGGGPFDAALANAIGAAALRGHIFVAAAGNNNRNNDASAHYPSSYSHNNIVSVAATDRNDRRASFSNYGATTVDLGAPGVSILSTTPNSTYSSFNGTSMATPHVTGVLSLVWDLRPEWTYTQVIQQVLSTVDPVQDLGGRTVTGGRLNARKALEGAATLGMSDTLGPRVTASSPSGTAYGSVGTARVTFNEPVYDFTTADINFRLTTDGINFTAIAVDAIRAVAGSNNRQFDVTFPAQSAVGTYALSIGPDIRDAAGNPMDQNGDGISGQVLDTYTASFTLAAAPMRFDFGTATSPVEPDHERVTAATTYASRGFGWNSGTIFDLQRTADVLIGDMNYTKDGTFVVPVGPGDYNVTLWTGDTGQYHHDLMGIYLQGSRVDVLSTAPYEVISRTYRVAVGADGVLSLRLKEEAGGTDPYSTILALTIAVAGADTSGPRVVSSSPTGTLNGAIDHFILNFDEPVTGFTEASIVGPGGPITSYTITQVSPTQYKVAFEAQTAAGTYRLTVGPGITDTAASPNAFDQEPGGTADPYTTTVTVTEVIGSDASYDALPTYFQARDLVPGQNGVATLISGGSNRTTGVTLGRTFNFYGTAYSMVSISTNGLLTFGTANSSFNNTDLASSPTQASIAPLWDRWASTRGNAMVLGVSEDRTGDGVRDLIIFEWNKVQAYSSSPSDATFQVILYFQAVDGFEAGDIVFNYPDLETGNSSRDGGGATVGIKAPGSSSRILIAQDSGTNSYVGSGKAIRFTRRSPSGGSIGAAMSEAPPAGAGTTAVASAFPAVADPQSLENQAVDLALSSMIAPGRKKKVANRRSLNSGVSLLGTG